jgi:small subunit ribosomal protein S9
MATQKYTETVGRRKSASARARVTEATKQSITVNGKDVSEYFPTKELQNVAESPLKHAEKKFGITVVVKGGGISGQATAVRHAITRALVKDNGTLRGALKKVGYLTRDPRAKERRKPGLKKARKAPQWSKR